MLELNRNNDPPRSGPEIWVRRLRANEVIQCGIISPHFWGFVVHWAGNRTEPCYRETRTCPGHRRGLPVKWKGYLYVLDHAIREYQFLEFPPVAATHLLNQFENGHSLRGEVLSIKRMNGVASRLKVTRLTDKFDIPKEKIESDVDPIRTLCKIWGVDVNQVNLRGENEPPQGQVA